MHILNKLSINNLKLNKKRTLGILMGIFLATALICAITGIFTSLRFSILKSTIKDTGYYHIVLYDKNKEELNILKNNRDIKDMYYLNDLGYSSFTSSDLERPYIHLYSFQNQKSFKDLSFILVEGNFPKNSNEIVISEELKYNSDGVYDVGKKLILNVGDRQSFDGSSLDRYNPLSDEDEFIVDTQSMEFTITGIVKRNYLLDPHTDPGISVITSGIDSPISTVYISLLNPIRYKEAFSKMLGSTFKSRYDSTDDYSLNDELLKWEAFRFSDTTISMFCSLTCIVLFIVVGTSVFCIKNSFSMSITERKKMYGMLLSVGATKKQIKRSVLIEGMFLGLISIPLGILAGVLAVYILTIIISVLLGNIGNHIDTIYFHITIASILLSTFLSFVMIYLSCISSAKKTSKMSPIDIVRSRDEIILKPRNMKCPKLIKKIFKTGGVIAYKNLQRSRRKYRTTVLSLIVSVTTFISLSSFITYGIDSNKIYYENLDYNLVVTAEDDHTKNLLDILKMPDIESYTLLYRTLSDDYFEIDDLSKVTTFTKENVLKDGDCSYDEKTDIYNCQDAKTSSLELLAMDSDSYKQYLKELGISSTSKKKGVLLDNYLTVDENGVKSVHRIYNYKKKDIIKGTYHDKPLDIEISKVTKKAPNGLEQNYYNGGYLIVSIDEFKELDFVPMRLTIDTKLPAEFTQKIKNQFVEVNVQNIESLVQIQNTMTIIISIFLYGFITVITLIGVTTIFNTITSNVELRRGEFAMLKSIGLTKREFNHMIYLETFFYSFKALSYGILLGILGSYLIFKAYSKSIDLGYSLPGIPILISIFAVYLLVFFIMKYSCRKIDKENIIETIRNDNI